MKKFCAEQICKQGLDELHIYDRGYPCTFLFFLHKIMGTKFLARVKTRHNKVIAAFEQTGLNEQIISLKINALARKDLAQMGYNPGKKDRVRLRLVRISTKKEDYILVTNLLSKKKYPLGEIAKLYQLRWGIETGFDYLKNTLQLEVFSGLKPEAVMQDCFASMALYNLATHLKIDVQVQINRTQQHRQHKYQANRHYLIAILKRSLIKFVHLGKKRLSLLINQLLNAALKTSEPIRENRSFPRKHKIFRRKTKYQVFNNHRSAM